MPLEKRITWPDRWLQDTKDRVNQKRQSNSSYFSHVKLFLIDCFWYCLISCSAISRFIIIRLLHEYCRSWILHSTDTVCNFMSAVCKKKEKKKSWIYTKLAQTLDMVEFSIGYLQSAGPYWNIVYCALLYTRNQWQCTRRLY